MGEDQSFRLGLMLETPLRCAERERHVRQSARYTSLSPGDQQRWGPEDWMRPSGQGLQREKVRRCRDAVEV